MKNTQKRNTSHRAQLTTSRGPWKSTRTDTFLLSQVGQEKEEAKGRGEEVGWGLHPEGDMKVRSGLHIRGSPSSGTQFGQKESLILCGREHGNPRVAAGQWDLHTGSWPLPCPPNLKGTPTAADKWWVLKCGVRTSDPGRGLRLALRRHPEGMGAREELYKRDACGGSLNHQRAEHKRLDQSHAPRCRHQRDDWLGARSLQNRD